MFDAEFHPPVRKDVIETADAPNSALAVVSLVFGIVGWIVLPLIGPLIALITGHIALGEIRDSEGRIGGRPLARAGLILGYSWFAVLLLAGTLIVLYLFRSPTYVPMASPAPFRASLPTGVKIANELSNSDLAEIRKVQPSGEAHGGDEVICYYRDASGGDGVPAVALLTTSRISYLKGDRLTSLALKDVEAVLDNDACRQKYNPNNPIQSDYHIEVKSRSGPLMRIVIQPAADGPIFFHALQDAWKAATGAKETDEARKQ